MSSIENILRTLGITAKLRGYHYLVTAIKFVIEEEDYLFGISKNLYPIIANIHHTTTSRVDRNIRTALTIIWERGNRAYLNELAGIDLSFRPTAADAIDILASYMRKQQNEEVIPQNKNLSI